MTDAFSEAISTDDSPAPEASEVHSPLLGDPATEGNQHLLDGVELAGDEGPSDDLHEDLNNADIQN